MGTKKIVGYFVSLLLMFFLSSFWANAEESTAKKLGVDHFKVSLSPDKAKVGELVDLTIMAVDKNDNIITNYELPVLIFSKSDPEVALPISLDNNTYKFTAANQGEIKFENSIGFTKKGVQDLYVYDFKDDGIFGLAEIEISEGEKKVKVPIDIISPEMGLIIPEKKIKISGSTKKNHKVLVFVNEKKYETTSNSNGIYEVEIEDLNDGENTISAQVLDSDKNIAGEADNIKIKVNSNNILLKNIKLIPEAVFTEALYEIEIIATPKLKTVSAVINDEVVKLEEKKEGVYTGKSYAPKEKGSYNVDVILKDELGHELKELGATTLEVKELESGGDNDGKKLEKEEPKKEENTKIDIKQKAGSLDPLNITGLKLIELKTKSILTWDKLEKAEKYNVYKKNKNGKFELADTVTDSKFEVMIDKNSEKITYDYFAVKAIGKTPSGEDYEGNLSDATKIKTGPEMLIIIIISAILGASILIFSMKRKLS